jgi:SAM-dependent methyltransferase
MLAKLDVIRPFLICPTCKHALTATGLVSCTSSNCRFNAGFPVVEQIPVLIAFEDSIINEEMALMKPRDLNPGTFSRIKQWAAGKNRIAEKNEIQLLKLLRNRNGRQLVLNIGGGTIGSGMSGLYQASDIDLISFDVYASPHVNFIADAHSIPIADKSVDGIWIQAVLEHVLDPRRVVSEILRVLKPGGLIYAETPFIQHVHMGPNDFTRFTHSGHRWLFRNFMEIDSGVTAGVGTQFAWSARHLTIALTRSRSIGTLVHFLSLPITWMDCLGDKKATIDAASGFYFLGMMQEEPLHLSEIINYYKGFQR